MTAMLGMAVAQARAETISISNVNIVPLGGGEWRWDYTVQLSSAAALRVGSTGTGDVFPDFLEVFDFAQYKLGSIGWAADAGNPLFAFTTDDTVFKDVLVEAQLLLPVQQAQDSALTRNLKINYSGAGYDNPTSGNVTLGILSAIAFTGTARFDSYVSSDTGPDGGVYNQTGVNFSGTLVPVAPTPQAVTGGLALCGLLIGWQTRRQILGA